MASVVGTRVSTKDALVHALHAIHALTTENIPQQAMQNDEDIMAEPWFKPHYESGRTDN